MIIVHRLRGERMFINADLVELIEANPDTVVTLVDGRRIGVAETPEQITERMIEYRAAILASADQIRSTDPAPLVLLPSQDDTEST